MGNEMDKYVGRLSSLAAVLSLALAACGGDPVGINSGDELSDDEIQAVFNAFGGAFTNVNQAQHRATPQEGIQLAEIPINTSVDLSAPCDLGGSIDLDGSASGTMDDETFESDITMDIDVEFKGCVVPSEQLLITVNGDIAFDSHLVVGQETFSVDGSQVGGFSFTLDDGRSGSCSLDIEFSASTTGSTVQSNVSGTVCGRSAANFEAYTGS